MAFLVDTAVQTSTGGATSVALTFPAHEVDDIIVVQWTQDAVTTGNITSAGWTAISAEQSVAGELASRVLWKRATSNTESASMTIGAADAYVIRSFVIRDVDTVTAIDGSTNSANATLVSQFTSEPLTTTTNDCFILYCHGLDGIALAAHSDPGVHFIQSADSQGATDTTSVMSAAAWYVQRTAGAVPRAGWRCSLTGPRTNHTIAFRNKAGGRIPAYIDDIDTPIALVGGHHFSTLNGISFPGALTLNNGGPGGTGLALTFDAAAAVADFGVNPYSSALSNTPPAGVLTGQARGFEVSFTPNINMSTGFVVGTVIAANPRNANFDHGSINEGGTFITFGSVGTNTNYRNFQVLARDSSPNTEGRAVFSVKPSQTTTAFGTRGTANLQSIAKMLFLSNNPGATITLYTTDWCLVNKLVVAGGTANNLVDTNGLIDIGSSFRIKTIQASGAAGLLSYVPIQIGGSDSVRFGIDGGSLQFPRIYNKAEKEINYHANVGDIGISYAGKSGDSISHTNSIITSASRYYWEINANATSQSSWDFTGLAIVNADVTLRNVTTFSGMTFSQCNLILANGCSLSECTVSLPPSYRDSLKVNALSSFNACAFDVTTVGSGNALTRIANINIFTNCDFQGTSSSGHAIEIPAPGSYNFSGNQFTGFGLDNSNSAAIFNNSGGDVTINVLDGGSSPTIRNGTGSTTNVINAVAFTVTNVAANTEVRLYRQSDMVELAGLEDISSGTPGAVNFTISADDVNPGRFQAAYSYNAPASEVPVFVVAHSLSYQWFRASANLKAVSSSLQLSQIEDRQYFNP